MPFYPSQPVYQSAPIIVPTQQQQPPPAKREKKTVSEARRDTAPGAVLGGRCKDMNNVLRIKPELCLH